MVALVGWAGRLNKDASVYITVTRLVLIGEVKTLCR